MKRERLPLGNGWLLGLTGNARQRRKQARKLAAAGWWLVQLGGAGQVQTLRTEHYFSRMGPKPIAAK